MKKQQILTIVFMLVLSAGPIAAARYYVVPMQPSITAVPIDTLVTAEGAWETLAAPPETQEAEEEYLPTPGELNMAHYFPEGADHTKVSESFAGMAFQILMDRDSEWLNSIYDYSDYSPAQLAKQLGQSGGSLMGKFNPNDKRHDSDKPSTWTINSFRKIQMTVVNGDGQTVNAYSNVIDIMSMANLYTYFQGPEDYQLFLSYCKELWDDSHSYSVKISNRYECSGCLGEDGDRRELEELEAEAKAEALGLTTETSAPVSSTAEVDSLPTATSEASARESTSAVLQMGKNTPQPETSGALAETTASVPESTSPVIVSGTIPQTTEGDATTSLETLAAEESLPAESSVGIEAASASNASIADPTTAEEEQKQSYDCPGHVDLIIHAKILGLKEERGLLVKDTYGNNPDHQTENGWPGWNSYTKASARLLSTQDWYDKYGLTLSLFSSRNPLTVSEVETYLERLPKDLSQTRKDLIQFALSSVGKVPYYWGGKPSSPGYNGNSFGILTTPDDKGRVLKGLDCSGWINWVYWSVTGKSLPYESTSGLAASGTKIRRDELQPGDIIIRTGGDAHVIMFLGWTDDGRILCIHESSAKVNNVTVAIRDANWPYYRKLVE